ncbi:hypothetical protein LC607_29485 [Nostoc sp. CHAB 5824]|nr:hypothetical protein [Nostoc sp. CHAB 5824]
MFYQESASYIFPDAWEEYVKPIAIAERDEVMATTTSILNPTHIYTKDSIYIHSNVNPYEVGNLHCL